jgi:tetratricopeptide (TPR) repeat protein
MNDLALLYLDEGNFSEAEALLTKVLDARRRVLGGEHQATLGTITSLGRIRLAQERNAEAEALFREGLKGLEKQSPDAWAKFNCQSLLGASLAGQGRYSEAEPLILAGYQGLVERESRIPAYSRSSVVQAGERIFQMYQASGEPDKAAEWRKRVQTQPTNDARRP